MGRESRAAKVTIMYDALSCRQRRPTLKGAFRTNLATTQVHVRRARGLRAFNLKCISLSFLTLYLFIRKRPLHPNPSTRTKNSSLLPRVSKTLVSTTSGEKKGGASPYPIHPPDPSGNFVNPPAILPSPGWFSCPIFLVLRSCVAF